MDEDARQVLQLAATGLTTTEIAVRLAVSPDAVRVRLRRAIEVLGATSKLEAVLIALQQGLIQVENVD